MKDIKNNISIYLIKEEFKKFDEILKDIKENDYFCKWSKDKIMYIAKSEPKQPDWLKNFFNINGNIVNNNEVDFKGNVDDLTISNSRALLLRRLEIEKETRIFAVVFGYGKSLIDSKCIEDEFGKRIVLNVIDVDKISKISKRDISGNNKLSTEQMPKLSTVNEFGLDFENEILNDLTAKTLSDEFGKSNLNGGEIFNLSIECDIDNIDTLLNNSYKKYKEDNYLKKFDGIDDLKMLKDSLVIDKLKEEIVKKLNDSNDNDIYITIPKIIDWTNIDGFKFTCNKKYVSDISKELFIESFENNKIESFSKIESKDLNIKYKDGVSETIPAHRCILGNVSLNGKQYILSDGKWYLISKNYLKEIERTYNEDIDCFNLPSCPDQFDEDFYNEYAINQPELKNAIELHRTLFSTKGKGNRIELCDIIKDKTLIHVKNGNSSSTLSHLFFQAINSCEILTDKNELKKINDKLKELNKDYVFDNNFKTNDYTIVLGIMADKPGIKPSIPFFSKMSLRNAYRRIHNIMGYNLKIANIYKDKNLEATINMPNDYMNHKALNDIEKRKFKNYSVGSISKDDILVFKKAISNEIKIGDVIIFNKNENRKEVKVVDVARVLDVYDDEKKHCYSVCYDTTNIDGYVDFKKSKGIDDYLDKNKKLFDDNVIKKIVQTDLKGVVKDVKANA